MSNHNMEKVYDILYRNNDRYMHIYEELTTPQKYRKNVYENKKDYCPSDELEPLKHKKTITSK